jgi:hypothetical protein
MTARVPFGLTRLSCSGVYQGVRANMEPTSACIGLDQYSRGKWMYPDNSWKLFRTAVASLRSEAAMASRAFPRRDAAYATNHSCFQVDRQPGTSGDYAAYFRGSGRSCPDCR